MESPTLRVSSTPSATHNAFSIKSDMPPGLHGPLLSVKSYGIHGHDNGWYVSPSKTFVSSCACISAYKHALLAATSHQLASYMYRGCLSCPVCSPYATEMIALGVLIGSLERLCAFGANPLSKQWRPVGALQQQTV